MSDTKQVSAIYKSNTQAMNAVRGLENMGFSDKDISFLVSQNSWEADKEVALKNSTKAAEGTAIGAGIGGVAGAIVGGLTAVGAVAATGGVGLLAVGPLVAALTGAGAAGATGGIIGGLIGMGLPEVEANYVDRELANGSAMIGVSVDSDRLDQAKEVLNRFDPAKVAVH